MNKTIVIRKKMSSEPGTPVRYYLDGFNLNFFLNRRISVKFEGFQCVQCKRCEPIFRQGLCKPCFFETPSVSDWVIRPELSQAHLDIEDRDLTYEKKVQLQPHIVYFAVSSGLKVGVTQKTQLTTRLIDQGAQQAIPIIEVPNRYLAGITEVALKEYYNDKTNWRQMLTQTPQPIDLIAERERALSHLPDEVKDYASSALQEKTLLFDYPINQSRIKRVQSLNMSKKLNFNGKLTGIKAQYLVFNNRDVLNIRINEGLVLNIKTI